MNENILYSILLVIIGIFSSVISIILLDKFFKRIIRFFDLYPESKGILTLSLHIISRLTGLMIFMVLLRLALKIMGLEFTMAFVERAIYAAPKYIVALIIVLFGFYLSRLLREKSRAHDFEFKNQLLLFIDLIINLAFIMTAFSYIGINIEVFLVVYKTVLWITGLIIAIVIGIIVGIPLSKRISKTRNYKNKKLRSE